MSKQFDKCVAPGVRGLHPYQPGKPISELEREYGVSDIIKLASNENPLGPSPKAVAALKAALDEVHLYPDGGGFDLKQKLSGRLGVDPGWITLGNGSNDVLDLICRAFLTPADEAVYSQYTFGVYPISVQAVNAVARVAPANPGDHGQPLGHDLDAMAALVNEKTRLVFIANPNNPTGTWVTETPLRRFVENLPPSTVVVVDEAYFEYVDKDGYPNTLPWVAEFPNLVVSRTFSKIYGLAGLRVGYFVSQLEVADVINRIRHPFNVNSLALVAAEAALDDEEFVARSRKLNLDGMQQLSAGLDRLGLAHAPSAGNFFLVDIGSDAMPFYEALLRRGVIVRPVGNYKLPNHLRMTIGTRDQNERLLSALGDVLSAG